MLISAPPRCVVTEPPVSSPRRLDSSLVKGPFRPPGVLGPYAQIGDPPLVAGVVGEDLRHLPPVAACLVHPLPEHHRLAGVVVGERRQEDADVVGLLLLPAA